MRTPQQQARIAAGWARLAAVQLDDDARRREREAQAREAAKPKAAKRARPRAVRR